MDKQQSVEGIVNRFKTHQDPGLDELSKQKEILIESFMEKKERDKKRLQRILKIMSKVSP